MESPEEFARKQVLAEPYLANAAPTNSKNYKPDQQLGNCSGRTKYPHKYDEKIWAGMTVADVIKNTKKQIAYGGCVVVDGVNGVGLPLPDGLDDFETITDFLEPNHVFENLSVFRL